MRIIAGALRGREIRAPKGVATRPAMARTREALFSMLEARGLVWDGVRALDLFAGTGSLAFEALSRGAQSATLVDNSPELAQSLLGAVADFELEGRVRLVQADALRFLRKAEPRQFELVFVDPPYRRDFTTPALAALDSRDWLAPGAFIAAEIEKGAKVAIPASFSLEAERLFGQTMVRIWQKS